MRETAWNWISCSSRLSEFRSVRSRGRATVPGLYFCSKLRVTLTPEMCKNLHMPTNLAIDDKLIEEARRLGEHKTKKQAVTTALEEYIQHRKQDQILEDFGTVDFNPDYDYKPERRRKRT